MKITIKAPCTEWKILPPKIRRRWGRVRVNAWEFYERINGTDATFYYVLSSFPFFQAFLPRRIIQEGDSLIYEGISTLFDALEEGELIPEYIVESMVSDDGTIEMKAFRKSGK